MDNVVLWLSKAIIMCIICLIVHGNSELVINQVKDKINVRHHYLNTYKNRVWDMLESFLAINFIPVPRKFNQISDALIFTPLITKEEAMESKCCADHLFLIL